MNDLGSRLEALIRRYVFLPSDDAYGIVVLWALHSLIAKSVEWSPLLVARSPAGGYGKSTLIRLIGWLCDAHRLDGPTPAATARLLDSYHDKKGNVLTLALDEFNSTFRKSPDEWAKLLNAGTDPSAQFLLNIRQGKDWKPALFRVYGPKALAYVPEDNSRVLTSTNMTRSIFIEMQKGTDGLERLPKRNAPKDVVDMADELRAWAKDVVKQAAEHKPDVPLGRTEDNYLPLIVAADMLGGEWPDRARDLMLRHKTVDDPYSSLQHMRLLRDIWSNFHAEEGVGGLLGTDTLLQYLNDHDYALEWADMRGGRGLSPHKLRDLLKEFRVQPQRLTFGSDKGLRGYSKRDLAAAVKATGLVWQTDT